MITDNNEAFNNHVQRYEREQQRMASAVRQYDKHGRVLIPKKLTIGNTTLRFDVSELQED